MNIERERAEFEAWYAKPDNNGTAWEAWQAALESQEVQALMKALKVLVDNGGIGQESMFEDARAALAAMGKQP